MGRPLTESRRNVGSTLSAPAVSDWYVTAMESLIGVVQELSQACRVEEIVAIVRDAARGLTGADGASFVLRDGDQCYYVDESAISPLWKGRRFPMSACISGWAMRERRSAVIDDIYADPRIPTEVYRPTFVKSLAMVPIRRKAPIGAIGNYWAQPHRTTGEELSLLQALADTTSVALENAQLYGELRQKVETLQDREARIQAQRDALDVFTRALAHDLREPVRTMQSFTELLTRPETPPRKTAEYLRHLHGAAERMSMLIETVFLYTQLDDTRIGAEACAMQDALDAARENLSLLLRERGTSLTADRLPVVHANPTQMMRVLQNLVSNAVYHGGERVAVHVSAEARGDHWLFAVRDDGLGIASADLERIFAPFKRLERSGGRSGLGLAICRKIVEAHGGRIWCESVPEAGSTFFFTLPEVGGGTRDARAPAAGQHDAAASAGRVPLANVLLVDDMDSDVELARVALIERAGLQCNLRVAYAAREALDVMREMLEDGETIDVALVDINMPGMDGFELMEHMRSEADLQGVPVAVCTGSTYERDKERARALGAVGYLLKPIDLDDFASIVDRVVGLRLEENGDGRSLVRFPADPPS